MNKLSLKEYIRPDLELSGGENNLLLHSCCAPCAGEIMEAVAAANIKTTVYFYNPNIHPLEEYEIRKEENKRLYITHDSSNLYAEAYIPACSAPLGSNLSSITVSILV